METNQTTHHSDELCSSKPSEPYNEQFKAAISPPTPLLLLPPPSLIENALASENTSAESNLIEQTKPVKQLALIEAHDSTELNLILNTIKQIFPGVNVQICPNPNEEASKENKSYLTVSRTNCSSPDSSKLSNVSRYCLGTKPADKKTCDRASSIDNSSFNMSMERQESKDSGFWTRTKCSFESMKSLSISDQPAVKMNNTNNSSNVNVNGNNMMNTNENDNETSRTNAPLSPSLSSGLNLSANSSKIVPEAQNENFLTSPRSSVSSNWKKWKKGQAWRYNSSSNSNLADTSLSSGQNDSASAVRTKDASFNSENSSFSIERTEDESNESYSVTNNSYFSNSFELATSKLSLLTTHQSNLQPSWSSTSKLEVLNNADCTNSTHQQKRRGKLVRERTIDNSDEQSSASVFNNIHRENIKFASSSNLNINDASEPRHESSRRFSKDGSPIPPNCPSPSIQQQNGRVSPPEKRLSLNLKSESTEEDIQAAIAQLHGLTSQSKLDANEIKQIMANVLTNKYFVSEELVKKITEITSEQHQSLRLNPSVSPVSSCPSPFSPGSSSSAAGLIPNVNKLSLLSPPSKSMSPNEFHKDLQAKLNLKSSFDSDDKTDMQECINNINNNINDNDNNDSNKNTNNNNNKLHESTNRNSYMLKTGSSSSFDFKFINNNYLSNGLPSQLSSNNTNNNNSSSNSSNNTTKSIYRSNSSPSYSSQLIDPVSMLSSPSLTKNISDINSDPPKLSNYQLQSTVYFPFSFDFPKQNHSSQQQQQHQNQQYNPNSSNFQQQQQHLIQKQSFFNDFNTYYPINPLELNISLSTKNQQQQYQLSNSRLIKPPEIVITESKVDNIQIDFEESEGKKSDFQPNRNASAEMITRPSDFNRSKLINNSYCFNQSFGNFVNKPSENMFNATNNWKITNPISLLNQSKEIKSTNTLQSPSSLNSSSKSLKPHICGSCQKRFARSDMLIRHSRLHSGVRPYRCNRCGQEFSRSDHLNTHLRTHTGEKPYTCPHPKCSYAACRKDMITRHLKVHSKNAVNRLSMSFDTAKLAENSMLNVASSATGALFNNLNRIETFCFENKSTMKNNLENINHKSTSSLASF